MLNKLRKFARREDGASAVEYGLVLGLIAVLAVGILIVIGTDLKSIFESVSAALGEAVGGGDSGGGGSGP